jgi:hypothetical protein
MATPTTPPCAHAKRTQTQNKVEGTIPPTFFDALINLTLVDLAYNSISGTIPTQARCHNDAPLPTPLA